jgi:hypothetical protein
MQQAVQQGFNRVFCGLLAFILAWMPCQAALAGPIDTASAVAAADGQDARDRLRTFIARADVSAQLQSLGVSAQAAAQRVELLSEGEVRQVAGQLDTLPAGASAGWAFVGLIILVGILVYYLFS